MTQQETTFWCKLDEVFILLRDKFLTIFFGPNVFVVGVPLKVLLVKSLLVVLQMLLLTQSMLAVVSISSSSRDDEEKMKMMQVNTTHESTDFIIFLFYCIQLSFCTLITDKHINEGSTGRWGWEEGRHPCFLTWKAENKGCEEEAGEKEKKHWKRSRQRIYWENIMERSMIKTGSYPSLAWHSSLYERSYCMTSTTFLFFPNNNNIPLDTKTSRSPFQAERGKVKCRESIWSKFCFNSFAIHFRAIERPRPRNQFARLSLIFVQTNECMI